MKHAKCYPAHLGLPGQQVLPKARVFPWALPSVLSYGVFLPQVLPVGFLSVMINSARVRGGWLGRIYEMLPTTGYCVPSRSVIRAQPGVSFAHLRGRGMLSMLVLSDAPSQPQADHHRCQSLYQLRVSCPMVVSAFACWTPFWPPLVRPCSCNRGPQGACREKARG